MSIQSRLARLENSTSINTINIGNELERLKALSLAGKALSSKTINDYKKMIKECDNPELVKLYQAAILAES
ncbi:hypothetical protein BPLS_P3337 [Bathymodiolus platifrons methanotrophic gill symbiont]|uniref:hypothetical protein n=1 Tax=Bathymodiolus platifrons methanotrophic gill symbiont TaxID=113268 RepID=UPI000B414EEF|nr:hypothetical protein [Bathymodiolus platifrons methanotrophic gill symbiont]TXL13519.1 hypothetical protein BMR04_14265 [Methylococcaceae bacterium HT3]GFO75878.1 hypothetical protein BPLS_P3337 [Bathymodiolus platifrons methanotrophic gill symbiont]